MTRHERCLPILPILILLLITASPGICETLILTIDQLYALASFQGEDEDVLLAAVRGASPDSTLVAIERSGSALRLQFASGEYMEVLNNELYSLASYIPPGIDRAISRRSSPNLLISEIERDDVGVLFRLESSARGRIRVERPGRPASPARYGGDERPASKPPEIKAYDGSESAAGTAPPSGETAPVIQTPRPQPEPALSFDPAAKAGSTRPATGAPDIVKPASTGTPPDPGVRGSVGSIVPVGQAGGSSPAVDGDAGDAAWRAAPTVQVAMKGLRGAVSVSVVAGSGRLFFLLAWPDQNPATDHRRWYWDDSSRQYRRSRELDDGLAIRWLMEGTATGDPRAGAPGVFDLWVWRAGREGLGEHASDARIVISDEPVQLARYFTSGAGAGVWFKQEYDRGSLPFEIVIPPAYSGDRIRSFAPQAPTDSAADVLARGRWKDDRWTVEMSRKVDTGDGDDVVFEKGQEISFVVSLLERKELDAAPYSEVLTLNWK